MYFGARLIVTWLYSTRCVLATQSEPRSNSRQQLFSNNKPQAFNTSDRLCNSTIASNVLEQEKWHRYVVKTPKDRYGPLNHSTVNKGLVPLVFKPLPLGSIKAKAWLEDQFLLMINGLPGHMHEFYRHIKDATWLGGDSDYSDRNEAWPYHINGLVPLLYGLSGDNEHIRYLKQTLHRQIVHVLYHQLEDGWLGPEKSSISRNLWARFPFFLALTQLTEAAEDKPDVTSIVNSMHQFVCLMYKMLKDDYQGYVSKPGDQFEDHWARSRAADMVLSLQWLYENHPGKVSYEIHESMLMLYEMSFDWTYWWDEEVFYRGDLDDLPTEIADRIAGYIQGVHAAVGLKYGAIMHRLLGNEDKYKFLNSTRRGVNHTFTFHGTSSGSIIADERMSGLNTMRGTELCTVVETMFSLTNLYQNLGDNSFADRLELAAFNALPAMVMPRWWAHQYVSQTNQPCAHELQNPPFWNAGKEGIEFGLEPVFPCCTVQMSQGYPKMLSNSWVKTGDNGLAHVVLVPSEVHIVLTTKTPSTTFWISSKKKLTNKVHITCKTNYPFTFMFEYTIYAERPFNFSVRIPSWTNTNEEVHHKQTYLSFYYYLNRTTDPHALDPDPHNGLHSMLLPPGHSIVEVVLSPHDRRPTIHERPNGTIAITYGPLLYALSPHELRSARRPKHYPGDLAPPESNDWTIVPRDDDTLNIALDPSTLRFFTYDNAHNERLTPPGEPLWDTFVPPVSVSALACPIDWEVGEVPPPPPHSGRRKCTGPAFMVELRPYGSAKIRVAEFPTVDLSLGSQDLWHPREDVMKMDTQGKSEL